MFTNYAHRPPAHYNYSCSSTIWRHPLYHQFVFATIMITLPVRTRHLLNSPRGTALSATQRGQVIRLNIVGAVLFAAGELFTACIFDCAKLCRLTMQLSPSGMLTTSFARSGTTTSISSDGLRHSSLKVRLHGVLHLISHHIHLFVNDRSLLVAHRRRPWDLLLPRCERL